MSATRKDVLKAFPQLGRPGHPDPDNPTRTNEDLINDWIVYWNALNDIISKQAKA